MFYIIFIVLFVPFTWYGNIKTNYSSQRVNILDENIDTSVINKCANKNNLDFYIRVPDSKTKEVDYYASTNTNNNFFKLNNLKPMLNKGEYYSNSKISDSAVISNEIYARDAIRIYNFNSYTRSTKVKYELLSNNEDDINQFEVCLNNHQIETSIESNPLYESNVSDKYKMDKITTIIIGIMLILMLICYVIEGIKLEKKIALKKIYGYSNIRIFIEYIKYDILVLTIIIIVVYMLFFLTLVFNNTMVGYYNFILFTYHSLIKVSLAILLLSCIVAMKIKFIPIKIALLNKRIRHELTQIFLVVINLILACVVVVCSVLSFNSAVQYKQYHQLSHYDDFYQSEEILISGGFSTDSLDQQAAKIKAFYTENQNDLEVISVITSILETEVVAVNNAVLKKLNIDQNSEIYLPKEIDMSSMDRKKELVLQNYKLMTYEDNIEVFIPDNTNPKIESFKNPILINLDEVDNISDNYYLEFTYITDNPQKITRVINEKKYNGLFQNTATLKEYYQPEISKARTKMINRMIMLMLVIWGYVITIFVYYNVYFIGNLKLIALRKVNGYSKVNVYHEIILERLMCLIIFFGLQLYIIGIEAIIFIFVFVIIDWHVINKLNRKYYQKIFASLKED